MIVSEWYDAVVRPDSEVDARRELADAAGFNDWAGEVVVLAVETGEVLRVCRAHELGVALADCQAEAE